MRREPVCARVGETADEEDIAEGVIDDEAGDAAERMFAGAMRRVPDDARVNDDQVHPLRPPRAG